MENTNFPTEKKNPMTFPRLLVFSNFPTVIFISLTSQGFQITQEQCQPVTLLIIKWIKPQLTDRKQEQSG